MNWNIKSLTGGIVTAMAGVVLAAVQSVNRSASRSATVREIPSTQIDPLRIT